MSSADRADRKEMRSIPLPKTKCNCGVSLLNEEEVRENKCFDCIEDEKDLKRIEKSRLKANRTKPGK